MADDFNSMVQGAQAPITQGLNAGAQWAQSAAQNAVAIKNAQIQQQQTNDYSDTVKMKKAEWFVNQTRMLAGMKKGSPLKKALLSKTQESAMKMGINLGEDYSAAIDDELYRGKIMKSMEGLASLAGDKAYSPVFKSLAEGLMSGGYEITPDGIEKLTQTATQLQTHKLDRNLKISEFQSTKLANYTTKAGEKEKEYKAQTSPIENALAAVPKLESGEPDVANMTTAQADNLLSSMKNAAGGTAPTIRHTKWYAPGFVFTGESKIQAYKMAKSYLDNLGAREGQEISGLQKAAQASGLDPADVGFSPRQTELATNATKPPEAKPPTAPAVSTASATPEASTFNPKKYAPLMLKQMGAFKQQKKSRSDIEKVLGRKLPDELAKAFGVK